MPPTEIVLFTHLFEFNHESIMSQAKDVTQAESLLQLPYKGNCFNWTVGHILDSYSICLEWMGQPAVRSKAEATTYGHGSQPMCDPAQAYDLKDMLTRLDMAAKRISATLANLEPADLDRGIEMWRGKVSLMEALFFMQWHVSYHNGQLEQLREFAGKNG
jgi:hypothetical protein